jgi:hypothetical protein
MMAIQNLRTLKRHRIVLLSQIGGKLCVLSLGTWNISKFGKSLPIQKIIGPRRVLARKDDGRYQARCVAKCFSQIPGKDFQENHAPVVSDTTLHLLMVIKTILKLEAQKFDIETAFLYGKLEEELWMAIPEGYERM